MQSAGISYTDSGSVSEAFHRSTLTSRNAICSIGPNCTCPRFDVAWRTANTGGCLSCLGSARKTLHTHATPCACTHSWSVPTALYIGRTIISCTRYGVWFPTKTSTSNGFWTPRLRVPKTGWIASPHILCASCDGDLMERLRNGP